MTYYGQPQPPPQAYPPPPDAYPPPGQAYAVPPQVGDPLKDGAVAVQPVSVETRSRGDGFWRGCCAALCCCCLLDMCF
ncbi:hypothetical protein OPV22_015024 [Ensete ventricosum]|uniref:Cysteine-rich transmembrane domain-containing protein n=1 Tax=Ensete ventricosum TaxID=4639 RepID=A0AAV8RAZ3_ENSVE|nr:hypothetical protein OPV22_015024 [Ensete ventricosum]